MAALVDNLMVLPCRLDDVGSQRCWLETSVMSRQNITLYDVVKIECTDKLSFLCRAWPRLDEVGDGYIQFDSTVLTADVDKLFDGFTDNQLIPVFNIQKVRCSAVESVSLTIIADWSEFVSCSNSSAEVLQSQIRNLLDGFIIAANNAVLCFRTALGKLFGWDRIIIHNVLMIKNNCSCGFITHSSEINVVKIVSKERFKQRAQIAIMLGGLDNETCLLRSIVLQCQQSELPDSLHKKVSISCIIEQYMCKCVNI